jgi:stress-induced morphogen
VKVSCYVETAKLRSREYFTVEIDDEEFDGLTTVQRDELIDEICREKVMQHVSWDWEVAS